MYPWDIPQEIGNVRQTVINQYFFQYKMIPLSCQFPSFVNNFQTFSSNLFLFSPSFLHSILEIL